tara:strand:+ start:913 stop:1293 length:381 start_codon:yes stop_codon:yes gene_type:complete
MKNKGANWNAKYITNASGRAFKISELSLKQTSSFIGSAHARMKTDKLALEGLYQRRAQVLGEPLEQGKTRKKILQNLQYKETQWSADSSEAQRITAIVLMALKHLQNGADVSLIEAILKQAREKDD